MTVSAADRSFYQQEIVAAITTLNQKYGCEVPMPAVHWKLTGRSRLGTARGWIAINLNAGYAVALGREEFRQTALHEACHIVTSWRQVKQFGVLGRQSSGQWAPHGARWKRAMLDLGLSPDRTAKVSTEVITAVGGARRSVRRYPVRCTCQVHEVTAQVYRKIQAGAGYTCRRCKTRIVIPRQILTAS